jgi:hypothetical protein
MGIAQAFLHINLFLKYEKDHMKECFLEEVSDPWYEGCERWQCHSSSG